MAGIVPGKPASRHEPSVTYHGPVAVWWIPKGRSPRVALRSALLALAILLPITGATMLWSWADSRPLWPFGRQAASGTEILMRYELILLTYVAYVMLRSLPVWVQYRRRARRDARAIDEAIASEQWDRAALLVHRYCLLMSAVWRRVPARVTTWDAVLRPRLPRHRRLYVYYQNQPPDLPPDVGASFTPIIIPAPHPPLWSAAGLIPVAGLLYLLLRDIIQTGYWQRAILFNALLLALILVSYGSYFFMSILGRSHYFRFAPGALQFVKFPPLHRLPRIETMDLRRLHAILDLASPTPGLTLLDAEGRWQSAMRLPRGQEAIEAVLRSTLSTAPTPPLPDEHLVG